MSADTMSSFIITIPAIGRFSTDELVEVYTISGVFEGYVICIHQGAKSLGFKDESTQEFYNIRIDHITTIRGVKISGKNIKVVVNGEKESVDWFEDEENEEPYDGE